MTFRIFTSRAALRALNELLLAAAIILVLAFTLNSARADESAALFFVRQAEAQAVTHTTPARKIAHRRGLSVAPHSERGVSLAGVSAPLAAKSRAIAADCGSTIISAVRHTRVAGTRSMSLHASGHAVDLRGNPGCIYAHLKSWPGGVSIDYGRVRHVHISLGGREDGLRFAHHSGRTRYAHRHHRIRLAHR